MLERGESRAVRRHFDENIRDQHTDALPLQDKGSTDSWRTLAVVERSVYTRFASLSSGLSQQ